MIELKGDDYILYIKGLDNEKLLYELIKQAVIFNGLAQQEQVTDDDILFKPNNKERLENYKKILITNKSLCLFNLEYIDNELNRINGLLED